MRISRFAITRHSRSFPNIRYCFFSEVIYFGLRKVDQKYVPTMLPQMLPQMLQSQHPYLLQNGCQHCDLFGCQHEIDPKGRQDANTLLC